jgi:hypothetical protein
VVDSVAAVAGAEREETTMRNAIALGAALLMLTGVTACGPKTSKTAKSTSTQAKSTFASPGEAADALIAACRANDIPAVNLVLGGGDPSIFSTGDPAIDAARCRRLVTAADQSKRLDPTKDGAVLVVGTDDYPVPAPIVQDASGWHFDAAAGAKEIQRRRVGENELTAIARCRAWAKRGGDAPAKTPGYSYRVVGTKQRPTLLAYPDQHGVTGVVTFQVARDGRVYEKDLGAQTATAAPALVAARDASWKPVWD